MERGTAEFLLGDATKLPLADKSVDLVFGSPPYCDARTYGIDAQRKPQEWVDFMMACTREAVRVSRGLVLWVCSGVTRDWCYWPACEGLLWEWWKAGGRCWRPAYWHRVGIPGSGGKQWLRADVEYVLCFTDVKGKIPWADNTANGHPPKWAPGGEMSYRDADGNRKNDEDPWGKRGRGNNLCGRKADGTKLMGTNYDHENGTYKQENMWGVGPSRRANGEMKKVSRDQWGGTGHATGGEGRYADGTRKSRPNRERKTQTRRKPDGVRALDGDYVQPVLANPGNVVKTIVGGGVMGHPLAHENEAPFPLKLAQWFIRSHCPPGGTVLDPFSGSGTTVHAAIELGRNGIGIDLRQSQVDLGKRRISSLEPPPEPMPLFDSIS